MDAPPLPGRTEHPRPLLRRAWTSLDGPWAFSLDGEAFDREIVVPFAPESPASGIGEPRVERCWYRRTIEVAPPAADERVLVHFGAVDRVATVRAGDGAVGAHEGGWTGFSVDVTEAARAGSFELTVRADDDPDDHEAPRGKQDWRGEPHLIWYHRCTGIWRTVWLERVPSVHVSGIDWTCELAAMSARAEVRIGGPVDGHRVRVVLRHGDRVVGDATARVVGGSASVVLEVGDGSIDDRWALPWWPRRPALLDAEVTLLDGGDRVVDRAMSYTALREVRVEHGRVLLNDRPTFLRLVLDQGLWPDTGLTPPDVDALRRDLELTRALGFNGVRKHQKTEDPRFFALADELGILTWVELPSAYRPSARSAQRLLAEWAEVVSAHRSHPSVIAWVPTNESWGVPALATDDRQRATAEALAAVARALDGTRPISVNDGWETTGGEIVGVHDYEQDPAVLAARYRDAGAVDEVLTGPGVSGHRVDLDRRGAEGRAVVLSELGGVSLAEEGTWGYATASSPEDLLERYRAQWAAVHASSALAGACWTQLTDTHQEANGLLRMDRTPKADPDALSRATRGKP
jgi:beta-galactosidase/beta-glucuronidase